MIVSGFPQIPKLALLPVMPEHCFAKGQSEWHVIHQRFQGARRPVATGKVSVGPRPEVAMAVSTVMPLGSESERVTRETTAVQHDLSREERVGVRRSRETNPALVAQRAVKCGAIVQVPGDRMSVKRQSSPAGVLVNSVAADLEVKWIFSPGAEVQTFRRESLNEALRLSIGGKP